MLLPIKVAQGVRDGSVTLAFRRWAKQDVEPGRRFTTAAGMVRVDEVTVVDVDAITDEEARLAGCWTPPGCASGSTRTSRCRRTGSASRGTARTRGSPCGRTPTSPMPTWRRSTPGSSVSTWASSSEGVWTMATLDLIRTHPQRRAPDLAEMVGRETAPFKLDVRKAEGDGADPQLRRGLRGLPARARLPGPDEPSRLTRSDGLREPADSAADPPYGRTVSKLLSALALPCARPLVVAARGARRRGAAAPGR